MSLVGRWVFLSMPCKSLANPVKKHLLVFRLTNAFGIGVHGGRDSDYHLIETKYLNNCSLSVLSFLFLSIKTFPSLYNTKSLKLPVPP